MWEGYLPTAFFTYWQLGIYTVMFFYMWKNSKYTCAPFLPTCWGGAFKRDKLHPMSLSGPQNPHKYDRED